MLNEIETADPRCGQHDDAGADKKIEDCYRNHERIARCGLYFAFWSAFICTCQKEGKQATDVGFAFDAARRRIYGTMALHVKAGTEVTHVLTDQGRLILHLRQPSGSSEIAIIDLATGREIQRIRLIAQD